MRMRTLIRTILVLAALSASLVATLAWASSPSTTPETVRTADFEPGGTSMTSYGPDLSLIVNEPLYAYWGPSAKLGHASTHSLWCAGTRYPSNSLETTDYPVYPLFTRGLASLVSTELAGFYSSKLSFWYLMPTLGDNDQSAFSYNFSAADGSGNPVGSGYYVGVNPVPLAPAWTQLSYDWTNQYGTHVSRTPAVFNIRFFQAGAGGQLQHAQGQGPAIDDVAITGYKYGPVRNLQLNNSGTANAPVIDLTWTKPANSALVSTNDTRDMSYRVWRFDTGTSTWDELTASARVDEPTRAFSDTTAVANHSYKYYVQAWDPSNGTGNWGELAPSADIVLMTDKATSSTGSFKDYAGTSASIGSGGSITLKVELRSHATSGLIPGMVQGVFAVKSSPSASMSGASDAVVTAFSEDSGAPGTYYFTVTPPMGGMNYRIDFLGTGASGFQASTGSPVLRVDVSGGTVLTTSSKAISVAYNGVTTVQGSLVMGSTPQPGEGDCVQLQSFNGAGWVDTGAAVTDLGGGAYSAITPPSASLNYFRLHFIGDGSLTSSSDLGQVSVLPLASLTRPSGSSKAKYKKYYTMTGTLRPAHSGAPVKILAYRLVGKKWKSQWTKSAGNSNRGSYSSYSLKVKLTAKGKWRFYAVHSDSGHAYTKTSYLSVTCR